MDHHVLGTGEDGELTVQLSGDSWQTFSSWQVWQEPRLLCGREEGRVIHIRWYLKDPPLIIGVARAKPRRGREGRDGFQGEWCLGRGKIGVRTSTIPGRGLTVTDQSALGTKLSPSI